MKFNRYFIILMCLLLFTILFSVSSFAEETTTASATETVEAVFRWEVIDESAKTANISSLNTDATGNVIVPATISEYKVVSISNGAFRDCTAITSVEFKAEIEKISSSAFDGCTSLREVILPSSLTEIGSSAFTDCTALEKIVLNEGLEKIGLQAFLGCSSLKTITIPSTVNSISTRVFFKCYALEKITVADGNEKYVADDAGALYTSDFKTLLQYPYSSPAETYIIAEGVTAIANGDFTGIKNIKTLVIPDSVQSIAANTFKESVIENLVIGTGLTSVGNNAFSASSLVSVEIASSPDNWDKEVFRDCINLKSVVFDYAVKSIPVSMFNGCTGLESVTGVRTVENINNYAFSNCSSLVTFDGGMNVLKIGFRAFTSCGKLQTFPFNNNTNYIDDYAFMLCSSLHGEVKIPDAATYLGRGIFEGCDSITSVEISENLNSLPSSMFFSCDGLTSITIPSNVKIIGSNCFAGCNLDTLVISEGVEEIGNNAFDDCGLKEINLPSSIKVIGNNAFQDHYATVIIIPEGVESIGSMAFNGKSEYIVYVYSSDCVYNENTCPYNRNSYYSTTTVYGYKGSSTESYIADCPTYSGEYHQHNYYDMCADAGLHKAAEKCADITTCIYCLETISGHADSDDDKICDDCGNSAELPSYTPDCSLSFSNGILTVSGTSIIDGDYEELLNEYSSVTETIVFNNGFVFVGENVFSDFSAVKFIFIPETMTVIGNNAFVDSSNIKSIVSFADELNIDGAFSSDSSFNLFNKAGSLISGTASLANINVLKHSFSNGILDFEGSLSSDLYDLFDVTTMFSLMYENILTLHFDHFEAVGFSVYSFDAEDYTPVDDSVFDNVDFTMYAFVNGEYTQISFNEMYLMSSEGYDGIFYLTTQTDDNIIHDDTQISIADRFNQAIERILSAIVRLFNKIFAFFSKLGR